MLPKKGARKEAACNNKVVSAQVFVELLANVNNIFDLHFDLLYGRHVQVLQALLLRSML